MKASLISESQEEGTASIKSRGFKIAVKADRRSSILLEWP